MLDRLVQSDDGGGLRHVGLGEEEGVLLHRDERDLDLVVALHRHLALRVRDVLDGQQAHALRVHIQRHVGLPHGHHARAHPVAGVEPFAIGSQLVVQQGGKIHQRSFLVHDTSSPFSSVENSTCLMFSSSDAVNIRILFVSNV